MADQFWHSPITEPKRNFRFELTITGENNLTWLVKTADKPKVNVSTTPHKYINHTFNYPGRVVWNPIAITLVDTPFGEGNDTSQTVMKFLEKSGYRLPHGSNEGAQQAAGTNIQKSNAVAALGKVYLRQLQNEVIITGPKKGYIDEWELQNAFIQGDIAFGTLDYASEELTTVSFTLQYDWAIYTAGGLAS